MKTSIRLFHGELMTINWVGIEIYGGNLSLYNRQINKIKSWII